MALIDPDEPLSLKWKVTASKVANCESVKEPLAKKVDNQFLFDVTSKEIESFMERVAMEHY